MATQKGILDFARQQVATGWGADVNSLSPAAESAAQGLAQQYSTDPLVHYEMDRVAAGNPGMSTAEAAKYAFNFYSTDSSNANIRDAAQRVWNGWGGAQAGGFTPAAVAAVDPAAASVAKEQFDQQHQAKGPDLGQLALMAAGSYFGAPFLGSALGIGSTAAGALAGGLTSGLTGGNPLLGAAGGALGGYFGGVESALPAGVGGIDSGSLSQILGNGAYGPGGAFAPVMEYTAKAASDITPTSLNPSSFNVTDVTDGVLQSPAEVVGQGGSAGGWEGADAITGAAQSPAAAVAGGAAIPAGVGTAAQVAGAAAAVAGAGGGSATDQQLNDAINNSGAPTPSYEDVTGAGGVSNGDVLTSQLGGNTGLLAGLAQMLGVSPDTLAKMAGNALPGLIGAYASNNQSSAYKQLADQFAGYGAPYRQKLSDLYANPSSFLTSPEVQKPVQMGSDIMARSLSTQGNPIGSGNALQQLQSYSSDQLFGRLGQEKDRLAGYGGLTQYNAAAPAAASNVIGSNANTANALGAAASNVFNPPKTLAEQLQAFKTLSG